MEDLALSDSLLAQLGCSQLAEEPPTLVYVTHHPDEILPIFSHTLLLRRGQAHSAGQTAAVLTEENLTDFYEIPVELFWSNQRPKITITLPE